VYYIYMLWCTSDNTCTCMHFSNGPFIYIHLCTNKWLWTCIIDFYMKWKKKKMPCTVKTVVEANRKLVKIDTSNISYKYTYMYIETEVKIDTSNISYSIHTWLLTFLSWYTDTSIKSGSVYGPKPPLLVKWCCNKFLMCLCTFCIYTCNTHQDWSSCFFFFFFLAKSEYMYIIKFITLVHVYILQKTGFKFRKIF
jgi:hypothetical protein